MTIEETALFNALKHQLDVMEFFQCQFEEKELPDSMLNLFDMSTEDYREVLPETIKQLKDTLDQFEKDCKI